MNGKPWYLSKTIIFAVVTVALGVAAFFGYNEWVPDAETAQWIEVATLVVIGVINLVLRLVTKEPIQNLNK